MFFAGVEKSLRKYFGKRGERVVQDNLKAVRRGYHEVIEVPREVMLATAEADNANAALRVMQAEGDRLRWQPFRSKYGSKTFELNVVDIADFNERVVGAYNNGLAEKGLPADDQSARSVVPGGTGALRDFSYIAPDIPVFIGENCVGCMECVTQCPDTAILGKVVEPATLDRAPRADSPMRPMRENMAAQWAITNKYYTVLEKKGVGGGKFGIFIDPTKCKGCAECVDACGDHDALKMIRKNDQNMKWYQHGLRISTSPCPRRPRSSSTRKPWRT